MLQKTELEGSRTINAKSSHSVEFLYMEDCPSHERALELLGEALAEEEFVARFHMYRLETDTEADEVGFPGSPTIRIDGRDIDTHASLPIGLACRAYRNDSGRISPLPQKEMILKAIRNAKSGESFVRGRPLSP